MGIKWQKFEGFALFVTDILTKLRRSGRCQGIGA